MAQGSQRGSSPLCLSPLGCLPFSSLGERLSHRNQNHAGESLGALKFLRP